MKLLTYVSPVSGKETVGVLSDDGKSVIDLKIAAGADRAAAFSDMLALIDAGEAGLRLAEEIKRAWPAAAACALDGIAYPRSDPCPAPDSGLPRLRGAFGQQSQAHKRTHRAAGAADPAGLVPATGLLQEQPL